MALRYAATSGFTLKLNGSVVASLDLYASMMDLDVSCWKLVNLVMCSLWVLCSFKYPAISQIEVVRWARKVLNNWCDDDEIREMILKGLVWYLSPDTCVFTIEAVLVRLQDRTVV